MRPELNILNPLNIEKWDDLVLSVPDYCFFHSAVWAKVLYHCYKYQPCYFSLIENNKPLLLIPVMQINSKLTGLRGVSLPFSDYCPVIIHNTIRFDDVFSWIVDYGKEKLWKSIEFRDGNYFAASLSPSSFFYGHTIELDESLAKIFSDLRSNTRRNIKKAIRAGVKIKFFHSINATKEYFRLHTKTRKRHGLPPQPFRFFKQIHDHVISTGHGFIVLAYENDRCIAGAIFFVFGKKAIYKFGASNAEYQQLRPNNLILWEAINWCAEHGCDHFCFGKTEPENDGLRQFKLGWRTKEQVIKYFKYDLVNSRFVQPNMHRIGFHNKIFRNMPISLLKLSGALIYRHIG